jgi:hypothetical protein
MALTGHAAEEAPAEDAAPEEKKRRKRKGSE